MVLEKRISLSEERSNFNLTLPKSLRNIPSLQAYKSDDEELWRHKENSEKIRNSFPVSFFNDTVFLKKSDHINNKELKVGVYFSGGPAAGGHNVIVGIFDALKQTNENCILYGFLDGPRGLLDGNYKIITQEDITKIRNSGGFNFLGTGRQKVTSPELKEKALETVVKLDLDGLIVIGGDGSNTSSAIIAEFFLERQIKTRVIGVPKTIDGDVHHKYIDTTFGFHSATKTYSAIIGNICKDAISTNKHYHFIKLMGRSASHITLECALQTRPNIALISEEIFTKKTPLLKITEKIAEIIHERANKGKNHGIILVPEGLIEFLPETKCLIDELLLLSEKTAEEIPNLLSEKAKTILMFLPSDIRKQILNDRDAHGNIWLSKISIEQLLMKTVEQALKLNPSYKGKFIPVQHFIGYEGRSAFPTNFDARYCYALGANCVALILNGCTGYLSVIYGLNKHYDDWDPAGVPIVSLLNLKSNDDSSTVLLEKYLVDLDGKPFRFYSAFRDFWAIEDAYRNPGPIQFEGSLELCNDIPISLQLEFNCDF